MKFLEIQSENEEGFEKIAEQLFNNYAIENHESTFRLVEIEFYWTSKKHTDKSVYKRLHVDPKQGTWFFHYSGVDIALKDEKLGGFGGILIRSIYDLNSKNKKIIKGPQVCAMRLFSGTSAFEESIQTRIVKHKFEKSEIRKTERIGLGNNAKENDAHKLKYRFEIEPA